MTRRHHPAGPRAVVRPRPALALSAAGALLGAALAVIVPPSAAAGAEVTSQRAAGAAERPAGPEFLPVDAIRPGMEGTARTVFAGDALEEFRVEILGVLENAVGPDQDLILARLHGEKVEYTGVVAGMSGSPVFVEGKLVGAISYRIGAFAKEAIAGITPIHDMLRLGAAGDRADLASPAPAADLLAQFVAGVGGASPPIIETAVAPPSAMLSGSVTLQPIGVPLVCSGCDPAVLDHYAPIFRAHGLDPGQGGGVDAKAAPGPLEPGSAIAAALVTGSLSLVGVGTLTYVENNRVYAFGHPMLGVGPVEIPMTQARVLHTFASEAGSFKIANATRPVGAIVRDGLTAIVGRLGPVPATLPLAVQVTDRAGRKREFRYNLVRDRAWSPVLAAVTTANSLTRTVEFDTRASLSLRARLDLEGYAPVEYEDLYAGAGPASGVHLSMANEFGGLLALVANNPFEEPRWKGASIEVEVLPEARIATLSSLHASRTDVRPGESLKVYATLHRYRGEDRDVVFDVTLPEDVAEGETDIVVGGGQAIDSLDRRVLERRLAQATDLEGILRLIARQRRNGSLYLRVVKRAPAAIVGSDLLPSLPLSVFSVLNNPRLSTDTSLMNETPVLEMERPLDVVVAGGRRVTIKVR